MPKVILIVKPESWTGDAYPCRLGRLILSALSVSQHVEVHLSDGKIKGLTGTQIIVDDPHV